MSGGTGLRVVVSEPSAEIGRNAGTLVLVHGSMDRSTSFRRLIKQLPEWRSVSYDRRGYAGSSSLGPPETFEEQVSDLVDVLGAEPCVVFGHSYGGVVVLAAASQRPDLIRSAMVWEPPRPWLPWWPGMSAGHDSGRSGDSRWSDELDPEDRAEWFMRRMVGDRVWERLPESTRKQRREEGRTLRAELAALRSEPPFRPENVPVPVLVGRGGQSVPHHRRSARELATSLPKGELCDIEGAGHGAHLSHPGELADLIRLAARRA